MKFVFACSTIAVMTSCATSKKTDTTINEKSNFVWDCKADREFITSYQYLKQKKEFGLKPEDMRAISLKVTSGCTGAASAFIETSELLLKSGLDGKSALEQSRDLAAKGEKQAKAFTAIFRGAFAHEFLDMDLGSSIKLARKLTTDFKGDANIAAEDYLTVARFCVESTGLNLPKPDCALLAARVAGYSEESKRPVAKAFIQGFEYLTQNKDVNITLNQAVPLVEALVSVSPDAVDNFKSSYEYASNKSGLDLPRSEAISFAKAIAINTKQSKSVL